MNKDVIPFPDNYKFDMGLYFSRGWELFRAGAGSLVGFTLLYFIIVVIAAFTPVLSIMSGLLQYCLMAGIYIFLRNLPAHKDEFSNFFEGFNHFVPILLFFLIISIFIMPLSYVLTTQVLPPGLMEQYMSGDIRPTEFVDAITDSIEAKFNYVMLLLTLIIVISAYLYVSYSFTLPLIADSKLQFWDAMESSRKIIGQKFFHFLGMYILLGLIMFASMIFTCGFGILVSFPFTVCVIFSAYDAIVYPPKEEDEMDSSINFT